jgi:hypothetical protein
MMGLKSKAATIQGLNRDADWRGEAGVTRRPTGAKMPGSKKLTRQAPIQRSLVGGR